MFRNEWFELGTTSKAMIVPYPKLKIVFILLFQLYLNHSHLIAFRTRLTNPLTRSHSLCAIYSQQLHLHTALMLTELVQHKQIPISENLRRLEHSKLQLQAFSLQKKTTRIILLFF